jgi:hypothetical protein
VPIADILSQIPTQLQVLIKPISNILLFFSIPIIIIIIGLTIFVIIKIIRNTTPKYYLHLSKWLFENNYDFNTDKRGLFRGFGIVTAKKESGEKIQIREYRGFMTIGSTHFFRIMTESKVLTPFSFKIKPSSNIKKTTENNKTPVLQSNEFKFLDSLHVYTLDTSEVENFLSLPEISKNLEEIKSIMNSITMSGKRLSINISTIKSPSNLISALKFISLLQEEITKLNTGKVENFEDYRCFDCLSVIEFHFDYCPHCYSPSPRCIICWTDPEPDDKMVQYECCETYAHRNHAIQWKEKDTSCPHCLTMQSMYQSVPSLHQIIKEESR